MQISLKPFMEAIPWKPITIISCFMLLIAIPIGYLEHKEHQRRDERKAFVQEIKLSLAKAENKSVPILERIEALQEVSYALNHSQPHKAGVGEYKITSWDLGRYEKDWLGKLRDNLDHRRLAPELFKKMQEIEKQKKISKVDVKNATHLRILVHKHLYGLGGEFEGVSYKNADDLLAKIIKRAK